MPFWVQLRAENRLGFYRILHVHPDMLGSFIKVIHWAHLNASCFMILTFWCSCTSRSYRSSINSPVRTSFHPPHTVEVLSCRPIRMRTSEEGWVLGGSGCLWMRHHSRFFYNHLHELQFISDIFADQFTSVIMPTCWLNLKITQKCKKIAIVFKPTDWCWCVCVHATASPLSKGRINCASGKKGNWREGNREGNMCPCSCSAYTVIVFMHEQPKLGSSSDTLGCSIRIRFNQC